LQHFVNISIYGCLRAWLEWEQKTQVNSFLSHSDLMWKERNMSFKRLWEMWIEKAFVLLYGHWGPILIILRQR